MKLSVVGAGYVGLVTAACLSEIGHEVLCYDINKERIEGLKKDILPLYEPGLDELVAKNQQQGHLFFSDSLDELAPFSEHIFFCVGTPSREDGSADKTYLYDAICSFLHKSEGRKNLILKSTIPPGSCCEVRDHFELNRGEVFVSSCPEFLRQGTAVQDFLEPYRVIIGIDNPELKTDYLKIFEPLKLSSEQVVFMDSASSEMTKYASNSMLATKISFMNELARFSDRVGADIEKVKEGVGLDARIGKSYLDAGCGYGGSCFPKDVRALLHASKKVDLPLQILNSVTDVNKTQHQYFLNKIYSHFRNHDLSFIKIAVWGLAFKPNTDDLRNAPSLKIIEDLSSHGALLSVYDPKASENFRKKSPLLNHCEIVSSAEEALEGADALVICTEWEEFFNLGEKTLSKMKSKTIFDGRNLFSLEKMRELGAKYYSVGRPTLSQDSFC